MTAITDDERWSAWCADFDEVEEELHALFHTRWFFRTTVGMLEHSGVPQYTTVQNYLVRTYVATICTAVRREADGDPTTSSLYRCLRALLDCPHFATRTRYAEDIKARLTDEEPARVERLIQEGFRLFASDDAEHIDPDLVSQDLERLRASIAPIRKYTNKVIAHRERRGGEVARISISFDEINEALDVLSAVARRYYRLRHPGVDLVMFTPDPALNFLEMFKHPWYKAGFQPPDAISMG